MREKLLRRFSALLALALLLAALPLSALADEGDILVSNITLSATKLTVDPGKTETLTATIAPSNVTDKTVTWRSEDEEIATVNNGTVTGIAVGATTITATAGEKSATCEVEVSGVVLRNAGTPLELFLNNSATMTPERYGNAASSTLQWSSNAPAIVSVDNGTVFAHSVGTATITVKAGKYEASRQVTVKEDVADAIEVSGALEAGETLAFSDVLSELNARSITQTGAALQYITAVSADPDEGVVYFGYGSPESQGTGVGSLDVFYASPTASQRGIGELTFVPSRSFSGKATISYVGYGSNGTRFSGRILVTVESAGDVTYGTEAGMPVFFAADDFVTACKVKTGQSLRYVTFRLPAKSQGTLYQSYNTAGQYMPPVTSGTKYQVSSGSLRLDGIVFVPAEGFSGTVSISYTAVDSSGASASGTVTITVSEAKNDEYWVDDAVSYTGSGSPMALAGEDFNAACLAATGAKLRTLSFTTLPVVSEGLLYLGYTSSSDRGTAVTSGASYTTAQLSQISFVPQSGFVGTVTIPFSGINANDKTFSGTVTFKVLNYDVEVSCSTSSALAVTLDAEKFRFSCVGALAKQLTGIEFTALPATSEGRLLLDQGSSTASAAVETGKRYYYSGTPAIGKIRFVPKATYQGTVEIPYIGYDSAGNSVSGVLLITVTRNTTTEFSDLAGYGSAISAINYLKENGVIGGYSDGTFRPEAATSRAAYAAMVCRLFGFRATVSAAPFPDVGKDSWCAETAAAAKKYGIILGDQNGNFKPTASVTKQQAVVMLQRAIDAAGWSLPTASTSVLSAYQDGGTVAAYARAAMSNMIALGVVEGDAYGYLYPERAITRVEMAQILYRLLTLDQ